MAFQRFCQTQSNAEIEAVFIELKRRYTLLGVPFPEQVIADCCCRIARAIKNVFPDIHVALDVYHLVCR